MRGAERQRKVRLVRRSRTYLLLTLLLVSLGCDGPGRLTGPSSAGSGRTGIDGTLATVDGLGGPTTVATDVNESLQVVGTAETTRGESHAFLWEGGEARDLGTLGGSWSSAADINDWGQVTGTSLTEAGRARAFYWADGSMHPIGTLGGRESYGVAINDRGEVVGYSTTASGTIHAFLWSHGQMHDLGTLGGSGSFPVATNDRGDIVGRSTTGNGTSHAFVWSEGALSSLVPSPARSSTAADVSENGHVLINTRQKKNGGAYVWSEGKFTPLTAPDGGTVLAAAINADGHAVGQISPPTGRTRAVLWRNRQAITLADTLFYASSTATAVSDAGNVTGAVRPDGASRLRTFLWSEERIRVLARDAFERPRQSTAGIAVTETGVVLGLAQGAADTVSPFLWKPAPADTMAASGRAMTGVATSRASTAGRPRDSDSGSRLRLSVDIPALQVADGRIRNPNQVDPAAQSLSKLVLKH